MNTAHDGSKTTPEARLAASLSGAGDMTDGAGAVFAAKADGPAVASVAAEADAFHEAAKAVGTPESLAAANEDPAVAEIRVDAD